MLSRDRPREGDALANDDPGGAWAGVRRGDQRVRVLLLPRIHGALHRGPLPLLLHLLQHGDPLGCDVQRQQRRASDGRMAHAHGDLRASHPVDEAVGRHPSGAAGGGGHGRGSAPRLPGRHVARLGGFHSGPGGECVGGAAQPAHGGGGVRGRTALQPAGRHELQPAVPERAVRACGGAPGQRHPAPHCGDGAADAVLCGVRAHAARVPAGPQVEQHAARGVRSLHGGVRAAADGRDLRRPLDLNRDGNPVRTAVDSSSRAKDPWI
mmetsp:Transcript_30774/g.51789  ORF Transcript_30774/g.51789 Transcript_30774/m.51789 type:complete len:266 (-) Transcript_30774:96-893(-)